MMVEVVIVNLPESDELNGQGVKKENPAPDLQRDKPSSP
jgi:hypothetical protein